MNGAIEDKIVVQADLSKDEILTSMMLFPKDQQKKETYYHLKISAKLADTVKTSAKILDRAIKTKSSKGAAMGGAKGANFLDQRQKNTDEYSVDVSRALKLLEGAQGLELLDHMPPISLITDIKVAVDNGMRSGLMLMYYYVLENNKIMSKTKRQALPSKAVVQFIAAKHNCGKGVKRGRPSFEESLLGKNTKRAKARINNIWLDYCEVSHLWAAWVACRKSLEPPNMEDIWFGIDRYEFFYLAGFYKQFICHFFDGREVAGSKRNIIKPISIQCESIDHVDIDPLPVDVHQAVVEFAGAYHAHANY